MLTTEILLESAKMVFTFSTLYWLSLGIIIGISMGALPGLTAGTAVALMLPVVFRIELVPALGLLMGVYKGAIFGGSISAIIFAIPGTGGAAATVIDGNKLMEAGKGKKALHMALYSSIFGDASSDIVTIVLAPMLALVALRFGPSERFLLAFIAFILIGSLAGKDPMKGLFSASIGLFLSTIGIDPVAAQPRMTFGFWWLQDGIPLVAFLIGVFAMGKILDEVSLLVVKKKEKDSSKTKLRLNNLFSTEEPGLTLKEFLSSWRELLMGTTIGTMVGSLPGLGATVASFLAHSVAKKISPYKNEIGEGSLHGVAAAESANNATCGPTLIPLLAFGIPGSIAAALVGSGLMMHGITPSARMFTLYPEVIYALFIILLIANVFNLAFGRFATFFYSRIGLLSKPILLSLILVLSVLGTYISRHNRYDVFVMISIGLLFYFMNLMDVPTAPAVLTFIITPIIETNLRRGLIISRGNYYNFLFRSPLSTGLFIFCVLFILVTILFGRHREKIGP